MKLFINLENNYSTTKYGFNLIKSLINRDEDGFLHSQQSILYPAMY